jgi:uncharacterized GH25 family protein
MPATKKYTSRFADCRRKLLESVRCSIDFSSWQGRAAMNKLSFILRVIGFAIALATCADASADDANQPANTTNVQQAVAALSQFPAWRHLDTNWLRAVESATADGPEMNVDVSVVSADGQPVAGAVVALQESIFEAEARVSLISEPFQPVRAVAVTRADGSCRFDAVPMTPAAAGKYGRIKAYVVIAHPTHGFDFFPLFRTSRGQRAEVTMREQVSMQVVVRGASRPQEVRVIKFDLRPELVYGRSGFFADAVFSPRAVVNEQGAVVNEQGAVVNEQGAVVNEQGAVVNEQELGKFASLPIEQFVGLEVRDQEGWKTTGIKPLLPTNSKLAVIDLSEPAQQVPVRFIDPVRGRPISNVSIERWKRPQQISGDDGLLVIRPAFAERMFRLGQVDKLRFTVEPPARFVREDILEYPHRIGSRPASFQLTPATIVPGRVVDAKTGAGIPNVVVQSQRPNVRPGGVTSQYHAVAVSDDSGSFELSAPPGRQTISVAAPVAGFLQPREQRVSVVIGKPVKQQTIRLTRAEPIRGRIVDQDGNAVAGAEVICHSGARTIRYRGGLPVDATIASGRTDDDGEFAIDRPQGRYDSLMIKAFADNRQSRDALIDFDPTSNRPIEVDLELSLGEQARRVELVGIVLKDGKPWVGAEVTADPPLNDRRQGVVHQGRISDRGSSQLGEATTDEHGRYRMFVEVSDHTAVRIGVRSDQWFRSVPKKFVTLSGSRIEVPPIEIREKAGDKTIKGVVVDPLGLPVAGLRVAANRQRTFYPDSRTPRDNPHRVTTNAKGEFKLRELYDGLVEIVVSPTEIPSKYAVSSVSSIPAGESNMRIVFDRSLSQVPELIEPVTKVAFSESARRIDFRADGNSLDPSTRISGVVVDQNGTPVADAIVRVFCVTPRDSVAQYNPLRHPACQLVTKTNSQGQFAIGPFPAGSKVRIAAGAVGLSARVTEFLSLGEQGANVEIKLTRIDPALPAMKTTHQLIDALGKPVPGAIVATSYQYYADVLKFSSDTGPCVLTDAQGNFGFPTVAGVDYMTVGAIPIVGPASVIRNDYSHRKYPLANPMSIRGRVVAGNGQPIGGFIVQVHNDRTVGVVRVATAGDGTFHIDDLPCGEEYSLSGSAVSQPKHSLLKRRFVCAPRQELNFGDLIAIPSTELTVKFVPAAGKKIPPDLSVQIGSTRITVPADGNVVFPSVAPGSVNMKINGSVSIARTVPPLQKTYGTTFAINAIETELVVVHLQ